jgi:hypothetical protein
MSNTKTFNDFNINNNPATNDYLIGVCSDGSAEFRTELSKVGAYTINPSISSIQPILGENVAAGINSVISGGINNVAGTQYSAVVGGNNNVACSTAAGSHAAAFVGGGHDNCACGPWNPVVVGGAYNRATGSNSFVGGGCGNHAYGYHSTIAGGTNNRICEGVSESVIAGGNGNCIETDSGNGDSNTISGGCSNSAYSWCNLYANTIAGGAQNSIDAGPVAAGNTVSGGYSNCISTFVAFSTTIGGGNCNTASAYYAGCSTIGGGSNNSVDGVAATISGGRNNCTCAGWAPTIAGGQNNVVHGGSSTVGGGKYNSVGGPDSNDDNYDVCVHAGTIAGGDNNCISGDASTIGGGCGNSNSGYASTVSGGYCNHSRHSDYTVIGGGKNNTIHVNRHCSSILGGCGNNVEHSNAHIIGSGISSCQGDATFVQNLISYGVVRAQDGAPGSATGFSFGPGEASADTGLYSHNYVNGSGNDGWVSLYSNAQEVLQADSGVVRYIRIADTANGLTYNLQVTNGEVVLTQAS